MPPSTRLYNPNGPDRVAEAAVLTAAHRPDHCMLRVLRGPAAPGLKQVAAEGPFPDAEAGLRFRRVLDALWAEGFFPAGLHSLLGALKAPRSEARGRAALRIGRIVGRIGADTAAGRLAVDALLAALPGAVDDACPILDALGEAGDPRAVPILRTYAERKLLSRRRSAVEALRRLGDAEGLAAAAQRGRERLPPALRAPVEAPSNDPAADHQKLVAELRALSPREQGPALDTLYELAAPAGTAAVCTLLAEVPFHRPGLWRSIKSIFKRALLRRDHRVFGLLAREFDARSRTTTGSRATVKSGYDGVQRSTRLFGRATQRFVRRAAWRHLRRLARDRPEEYPAAAVEALVRYRPEDAADPGGLHGRFSSCWVLSRILFGGAGRFAFDGQSVRCRFRNPSAAFAEPTPASPREEAFPQLWDRRPELYLRVLGEAGLPECHVFAVRALSGPHRAVLEAAPLDSVLGLLSAPYEPTVRLGLEELERRFDPAAPNWTLIGKVVFDAREAVGAIDRRWLGLTAPLWSREPERALEFLTCPDPAVRSAAAEHLLHHLAADPEARTALATLCRSRLSAPERFDGEHEGLARVAREGLAAEIASLFTFSELMALVAKGSASAQAVAGDLLDRRGETLDTLPWETAAVLAEHAVAAVRRAALGVIRRSAEQLRADPSALFALGESEWPEVRAAAAEMLAAVVDPAGPGPAGLVAMMDSNRAELQSAGRDRTLRVLPTLDGPALAELVDRLIEHPAPRMRAFALELMTERAPAVVPGLEKLRGFCRRVLPDAWPSRRAKRRVLELVTCRGATSPAEAAVAIGLLEEAVRLQTVEDFERALEGLVRLRMAFPSLPNPVTLPEHSAPLEPAPKKGGAAC